MNHGENAGMLGTLDKIATGVCIGGAQETEVKVMFSFSLISKYLVTYVQISKSQKSPKSRTLQIPSIKIQDNLSLRESRKKLDRDTKYKVVTQKRYK
jgi:hypothetical protein